MGEIVILQTKEQPGFAGYKYELPDKPPKEEIAGWELSKKEQYWRIPERKKLSTLNAYEKIEYIGLERDRWLYGYWFMNNGVATYITGMHYDHMVNMSFEEFTATGGRAKYFDQQRLDFYMRDLARKDPNCFGVLWLKPRRYGMTAEEITQATYTAMEDFSSKSALMSDEGNKAKETLLDPIIYSFMRRPKYSRPKYHKPNGKKPSASLKFTNDDVDDDDIEDIEDAISGTLGGGIYPCKTTPAANDGKKRRYIVMDEVWKWKTTSPEETYGINKKCVVDFGIRGKISVLSTMGDSDAYANAIQEGIKMWYNSNPDIRDDNGRTTSGLYRYFVSAVHSKELPAEYTDRYGFVDEERAKKYIHADLAKFDKNTKEYVYEMRRMPLRIEDALSTADTKAIFSRARITMRLKELGDLSRTQKPYVMGVLTGPDVNGKVVFEPDEYGKWKMAIQPYFNALEKVDVSNRFHKYGADYHPPRNPEGCVGYDPVRYAETTSENISRAAIIVKSKFDYFTNDGRYANRYRALWIDRPEVPEDGDMEYIKAMLFFGYMGMHEAQVERVEKTIKDEHMTAFVMKTGTAGGKQRMGLWTSKQTTKASVDMKQSYWALPKEGTDKLDYLALCPFEEVLLDADTLDPANTTKSDVFMCDGMCDHGLKDLKYTPISDQPASIKKMANQLVPKRN